MHHDYSISPISSLQSFQFLVDVLEFKQSVYAVVEVGGKNEDTAGKGFEGYLTIVQEFVEPDARSEVRFVEKTVQQMFRAWWCLKTAPGRVPYRDKV